MQRTKANRGFWLLVLTGMGLNVLAGPAATQSPRPATSSAPVRAESGTIPAGKFQLRYRIEGTGRPAIVIGSAVYYPRVFSQNLRKQLRLVFLDHRGFAASPGKVDRKEFALDKLVDDVERARLQLGLGKIIVIGHSGHGLIALEYAKKYPASVSHLIMIEIAPDLSVAGWVAAERYWQESVSPERKAAEREIKRRLPNSVLAKMPAGEQFVMNYLRSGPRAWYDFHFDASPLWEGVEVNTEMFDYVWGQAFRDIDITQGLASFDRPVLLALGRYDFIVAPPASWDRIRPKFGNLTVRIFERSGHTPQYEEPELFDAELMRWIAEHP